MRPSIAVLAAVLCTLPVGGLAQGSQGDATFARHTFKSGETFDGVRIHYTALGKPRRDAAGTVRNAVLILHGTGGSGRGFLSATYGGELFGPGRLLDTANYYVILPDNIGHGGSSKPSDGQRMKFPHYNYDDMVALQYRLLTEHLGVNHLRLVMGTSMGCMHIFVWGETHPSFARALMPMACEPIEIAGLNRMWRQLAINGIKADPAWQNGDYKAQPTQGLRTAQSLLFVAGAAPLYYQAQYPTREAASPRPLRA